MVTAPAFADALSEANSEIVVDFAGLMFLDAVASVLSLAPVSVRNSMGTE